MLLAEDQDGVRRLVAETLRSLGYSVIEATDGQSALMVAREFSGEIHLLLTDMMMPGMNGADLAKWLKIDRPSIRVLYMTAYTTETIVRQGFLEPGVECIRKPFTAEMLAARIHEALRD